MKKIGIVCCYFGKLPNYFHLWLKSCAANPTIDWLFFGDQKLSGLPENVKHYHVTLEKIHKLCREKIDEKLILPKPYKICDYKVFYGSIFTDYLVGYDFWGYCDFDMIFGDLREFFSPERLEKFDKILPLGHLSIYRNTPEVNKRFRCAGSQYTLHQVLTDEKTCAFDEWRGIYAIYKHNDFPMCDDMPFADITCMHKRLTIHSRTSCKYKKTAPNFEHQVFYWENGKIYRTYIDGNKRICQDTFLYIHLARRQFPDAPEADAFYCTPAGFVPKIPGVVPGRKEIDQYNPFYGKLFEWIERRLRRRMMKRENHRRFAARAKTSK